jgi:methionyl aminopeptidase
MIHLRSRRDIEKIRESCRFVVEAFEFVEQLIEPGITTAEIDREVDKFIRSRGGVPIFKGYSGFPASSCISVEDEVVHGIPGSRKLRAGELVSIDIGVLYNGWVGDGAKTYPVGKVSPEKERLMRVTREALYKGLAQAKVGNRLSDISHAVQEHVEAAGYSVVRELVGHGVGRKLHEEPQVPNFGPPGQGPRLRPGMVLAIEPMVNMGSHEVETAADRWTVRAIDGLPSAHFEHTIAITNGEPDILTEGL